MKFRPVLILTSEKGMLVVLDLLLILHQEVRGSSILVISVNFEAQFLKAPMMHVFFTIMLIHDCYTVRIGFAQGVATGPRCS